MLLRIILNLVVAGSVVYAKATPLKYQGESDPSALSSPPKVTIPVRPGCELMLSMLKYRPYYDPTKGFEIERYIDDLLRKKNLSKEEFQKAQTLSGAYNKLNGILKGVFGAWPEALGDDLENVDFESKDPYLRIIHKVTDTNKRPVMSMTIEVHINRVKVTIASHAYTEGDREGFSKFTEKLNKIFRMNIPKKASSVTVEGYGDQSTNKSQWIPHLVEMFNTFVRDQYPDEGFI